jgi:pSer/pThr/pTyr-binding forkhead associated (FHA) protein
MSTMTTQDQNKKTLRHFQCRDYLWEIFEQMSAELECSTDYLINEAMRQYARSRNYGTSRRGVEPPISTQPPPPHAPSSGAIPSLRENIPQRAPAPTPPPRPSRTALPAASPRLPSSMPPPPRPAQASPNRPMSMPPPLPAPGRQQGQQANAHGAGRPQLYVIFNGQKMPVTKDEFIIGRGSKSADLAIKDGNISRRHAAVVWHNGSYYMKDLGSTNGVEYQGRRFDSKRIDEGDLFRICDYELRFSYQ